MDINNILVEKYGVYMGRLLYILIDETIETPIPNISDDSMQSFIETCYTVIHNHKGLPAPILKAIRISIVDCCLSTTTLYPETIKWKLHKLLNGEDKRSRASVLIDLIVPTVKHENITLIDILIAIIMLFMVDSDLDRKSVV